MFESWQQFQLEFGRYLRDPAQEILPEGVLPRRAKVYEELLFNNVCGFLNSCFPVCQKLISADQWLNLSRAFYRDWRCHSPRFNDIPKEFLEFLASEQAPDSPYPWFWQLAHYEWVELVVDTFDETGLAEKNLTAGQISANPSLHNLVYDWPVHQISPDSLPQQMQQTFLLVYRDREDEVCFTEVNAATSALIHLIQAGESDPEAVLQTLAGQLQVGFTEAFLSFGRQMIQQLSEQGVLIQHSK
jgi:hypothetical protein